MPSLVVDSVPWKAVPREDARRRSLKDEGRVRLGMEKARRQLHSAVVQPRSRLPYLPSPSSGWPRVANWQRIW